MPRVIAAIVLAIGVLAVGGGVPATAHQVPPVERGAAETTLTPGAAFPGDETRQTGETVAPAPAPASPFALATAILALAALLLVIPTRRRALVLGLALVILVLTFESAIHSVHHLGRSEESKCAVGVAATHVQGTFGEPVIAPAAPASAGLAPVLIEPVRRAAQLWRAWRGRAPPSISIG